MGDIDDFYNNEIMGSSFDLLFSKHDNIKYLKSKGRLK